MTEPNIKETSDIQLTIEDRMYILRKGEEMMKLLPADIRALFHLINTHFIGAHLTLWEILEEEWEAQVNGDKELA